MNTLSPSAQREASILRGAPEADLFERNKQVSNFDSQRDRLTRLEAPEPLPEQYLGVEWDEAECGTWSLSTGQFLLASVVVIIGAIALVL